MLFGLKNAPIQFQRYIKRSSERYMDDFLIATDTLEKRFKTLN